MAELTEARMLEILNEMFSTEEPEAKRAEPNPTTEEDEAELKAMLESLEKARSKFMEGKSKHVYKAGTFSRWV